MAVDTFLVYVGVYDNPADADTDYQAVKDLHTKAGLIDAYDAAVVERRADGKVMITKKHETPTRVGGVLGAGVGLATGLVVAASRPPPIAANGNRTTTRPVARPTPAPITPPTRVGVSCFLVILTFPSARRSTTAAS